MTNEPKKAILDDFFSKHDDVRLGQMFGYPAYYVGRSMFACLYEGVVGLKLPEAMANEAREKNEITYFQPHGKPKIRRNPMSKYKVDWYRKWETPPKHYQTPQTLGHVLFSCRGRIGRAPYWMYAVGKLIMCAIIHFSLYQQVWIWFLEGNALLWLVSLFGPLAPSIFLWVVILSVFIYPDICVMAKRLHDLDANGAWCIFAFIPYLGALAFVLFGAIRGDGAPNKYGDVPK